LTGFREHVVFLALIIDALADPLPIDHPLMANSSIELPSRSLALTRVKANKANIVSHIL
jgi:hypothetical protein